MCGNTRSIRSTSSGAAGAPPYDARFTEREVVLLEVRRFEDAPHHRGDAADRVTFSRSIVSIATSGSNLPTGISTTLAPVA